MKKVNCFLLFFLICGLQVNAQNSYWQQRVKYAMDIDMDVRANRFAGKQKLEY